MMNALMYLSNNTVQNLIYNNCSAGKADAGWRKSLYHGYKKGEGIFQESEFVFL